MKTFVASLSVILKKKSPNFEDTLNRTWYIKMVKLSKALKILTIVTIHNKTKILSKKEIHNM